MLSPLMPATARHAATTLCQRYIEAIYKITAKSCHMFRRRFRHADYAFDEMPRLRDDTFSLMPMSATIFARDEPAYFDEELRCCSLPRTLRRHCIESRYARNTEDIPRRQKIFILLTPLIFAGA